MPILVVPPLRRLLAAAMICLWTLPASAADQRLKDLLGRAQQQLDGKAVEDLVGKLEGAKSRPPEPKAPETKAPEVQSPANMLSIPGLGQPTGRPLPSSMPTAAPAELAAPAPPPPPASSSAAPAAAPQPQPPPTAAAAPGATPPARVPAAPASAALVTPPAEAAPAPSAAPSATRAASAAAAVPAEPAASAGMPSVDLEITFEFNSAEISPAALPTLALLGRALSDPRLAGATFLIAGHTDAKGRADYNRHLSQLRAEAVRAFLIASYAIAPKRLTAKGFGEARLKNPAEPQSAENRRVQIVNTSKLASR